MLNDLLEKYTNFWLESLERRKIPVPYWYFWPLIVVAGLFLITGYLKNEQCIYGMAALGAVAFAFYFLFSGVCWRRITELKKKLAEASHGTVPSSTGDLSQPKTDTEPIIGNKSLGKAFGLYVLSLAFAVCVADLYAKKGIPSRFALAVAAFFLVAGSLIKFRTIISLIYLLIKARKI